MISVRAALTVAVVTVALVAVGGGVSVAQSEPVPGQLNAGGEPDLDVHLPNPIVTPGETNEVTLQISNDGELDYGPADAREVVTTARNVRVSADADGSPLTVESGETAIGAVTETRPGDVPIAVSVPDDIEEGTYSIDVRVRYSHTFRTGAVTQDRSRTLHTSVDVEVDSDARFEIVSARTDAQVGDSGTLEVELENVGADAASDANVILESSSVGLGFGESARDTARIAEIDPGETATVRYDIGFTPDAPVREYALDASVAFRTPDGLQRLDETPSLGVVPAGQQRFVINDVESDLRVGESGTIHGTVTNDGPAEARNVVVRNVDESPSVIPLEPAVTVGTLESGESADFRLPVRIGGDAEAVDRPVDIAVQYRNADDQVRLYEDTELLVSTAEQQQFTISDTDSDLYVGERGDVRGTVTNDGPVEARNVVVRYMDESPNVIPIETAVAVGTLDAGESTDFRLPVEISGEAEAVDRTADIAVQYRNADNQIRLYEDTELLFGVSPKRDQFSLEVQPREIAAGTSTTVDVEVTNNLDQSVSDVEARLFADSPLDSSDDEAFVEELASGESTTMTFALEADSSATAKTYPISFDFRYDDERGNSQLSDTTRVSINVTDDDGSVPWLLVVLGVLVVIAVAGGAIYYTQAT